MEANKSIKKIAIIGPESTGKSMLCTQLAAHYQSQWVREHARAYLEKKGSAYKFEDLYEIAKGQIADEDAVLEQLAKRSQQLAVPLFIDTDLSVIKIWSEFVFNKCDNRILTEISKRKYDLYLLCNIDLPWVADELREYPDIKIRRKLFNYYKEDMAEQKTPCVIISGSYHQRLQSAVSATDKILQAIL